MSNENVVSMVDSLTNGDNVAAQDAFKSALTDKIGQALDDKRQTVANDWLNAGDNFEAIDAGSELSGTSILVLMLKRLWLLNQLMLKLILKLMTTK